MPGVVFFSPSWLPLRDPPDLDCSLDDLVVPFVFVGDDFVSSVLDLLPFDAVLSDCIAKLLGLVGGYGIQPHTLRLDVWLSQDCQCVRVVFVGKLLDHSRSFGVGDVQVIVFNHDAWLIGSDLWRIGVAAGVPMRCDRGDEGGRHISYLARLAPKKACVLFGRIKQAGAS